MFLSDLQNKDIISVKNGRIIGHIIDVKIDETGKILYLVVEEKKGLRRIVSGSGDFNVTFSDIERIGEDVILVNV